MIDEAGIGAGAATSRRERISAARGRGRAGLAVLRDDRQLAIAVALLGLLVFSALAGPLLWRVDPISVDLGSVLLPPSAAHPMGTDGNGHDMLTRFNHGARISLAVAVFVVVSSGAVGTFLGLVSGTSPGRVDAVVMRCMDALLAFPPLILAMAVTVGLGSGLVTAALGISLSVVPRFARLVRSNVVRIRALPMIEASVALGASRRRIMFRHILPQAASTIFVESAVVFGYAIVTLASLGFVGLGVHPPTPEWGSMITDGLQYALTGEWWITVFPGIGVLLGVVAANLLGDSLQARLDPRGRRGRAGS
jgi:peptide/nickel transport system permease protein